MKSELSKVLEFKLNKPYTYYGGGEQGLIDAYQNGAKVEFRKPDNDFWLTVPQYENLDCLPRVTNERYHFRVSTIKKTLYGILYKDGEYLSLVNTEEHTPSTNLVVSTENGKIINVIYVGS